MKIPSIQYPRHPAIIDKVSHSDEIEKLDQLIAGLVKLPVVQMYIESQSRKETLQHTNYLFTCWKCHAQSLTSDLVMYDFISHSDGPDETQYSDKNIICSSCKAQSTITEAEAARMNFNLRVTFPID